MQGRTFALIVLFIGALTSFGLAIWSALQGRLPVIETAHAVLFSVMGLILAAKPDEKRPGGCRECGTPMGEYDFCIRCGSYPKTPRSPEPPRKTPGNPSDS